MPLRRVLGLVLAAAGSLAPVAHAGPHAYECVVVEVKEVSPEGKLVDTAYRGDVGTRFHVDRASGVVLGASFMTPLPRAKATVVDPGGDGESFKIVYIETKYGIHKGVELLEIEEWVQGHTKPFQAFGWKSILTGTCR